VVIVPAKDHCVRNRNVLKVWKVQIVVILLGRIRLGWRGVY